MSEIILLWIAMTAIGAIALYPHVAVKNEHQDDIDRIKQRVRQRDKDAKD